MIGVEKSSLIGVKNLVHRFGVIALNNAPVYRNHHLHDWPVGCDVYLRAREERPGLFHSAEDFYQTVHRRSVRFSQLRYHGGCSVASVSMFDTSSSSGTRFFRSACFWSLTTPARVASRDRRAFFRVCCIFSVGARRSRSRCADGMVAFSTLAGIRVRIAVGVRIG